MSDLKEGFQQRLGQVDAADRTDLHRRAKRRAIFFGGLVGLILVVTAMAGVYVTTYGDRAAPATYLSGRDVGGQTRDKIAVRAKEAFNQIKLKITCGDKTVTATAGDLGLTLDQDATVDAVIRAGTDSNILVRFNPFIHKNVALRVTSDLVKGQRFLDDQFADMVVPTFESTIVYNDVSAQFDVKAGEPGKVIDLKKLQPTIDDLLGRARTVAITGQLSDVAPAVSIETATAAQQYMNQRLGLHLDLTYQGKLLYFLDPPDIASWAIINPNPDTGKIDISFDKAAIKQSLTTKVAPSLAAPPKPERILVDKTGQQIMVLQHGAKGRQLQDLDQLVGGIYNAVTAGQDFSQNMNMIEADYTTETLTADDNNWIEVNLSNQTTTLWVGTQPATTFSISSGAASLGFGTPTGEYRIYYKTPSQLMANVPKSQCYVNGQVQFWINGSNSTYCLPNVTWVSYFYKDYAFHGKYWNNIFGRPSSHGCINMREADAKTLYDFAPLGTRVIVHY